MSDSGGYEKIVGWGRPRALRPLAIHTKISQNVDLDLTHLG